MTNHFTQEEAVALAKQSQGPKSNGVVTAHWLDMDFAALTRLCNAAVDEKLDKAGEQTRGDALGMIVREMRYIAGISNGQVLRVAERALEKLTNIQASEPAPSTARYSDIVSDGGMDPRNSSDEAAAALLEAQPKREPLTEVEVQKAIEASDVYWAHSKLHLLAIARAIEAAHKIGGQG